MGWLLAWLVFGLLAAYQVGEVAMQAGGEWTEVSAIAYLVASVASLGVIAAGAVRDARPGVLRALLGIALLGLAACLWSLYGSGRGGGWVATAMAGAAYLAACVLISGMVLFVAWRRQATQEERVALARVERERQSRLERIHAEARTAANPADDRLDPDADFSLPPRPKWDDN